MCLLVNAKRRSATSHKSVEKKYILSQQDDASCRFGPIEQLIRISCSISFQADAVSEAELLRMSDRNHRCSASNPS